MSAAIIRQSDGETWLFDALKAADFDDSETVTDHPVEARQAVSDHSQRMPTSFILEVEVAQRPLTQDQRPSGEARIRAARAFLESSRGELLDVFVPRRGFTTSCLLVRLGERITPKGNGQFTIALKQVVLATLEERSFAAIEVEPTVTEEVDGGDQAKESVDSERGKSALKTLDGRTGGVFGWLVGQ